ncbi:MAG: SH3 domain-containing protein [Gemmatimonadota bacterium]
MSSIPEIPARVIPTLLAALLTAGGCSYFRRPPPPEPVPVEEPMPIRADTVVVEVEPPEMAQMERRIAALQLQLLERDAQNRRLAERLNETRQELVRNMAKLQSQASRAEAASGIAEAEIALQALASVEGGSTSPEYSEGLALLAQSSSQFEAGNFGGALYLAAYARSTAGEGQSRLRENDGRELVSGESVFLLPVSLSTTSRSNVRRGPGMGFPVEFVLDEQASVSGISYSGEWVRIVDGTGREGWIFHALVTSRQ